MTHPFPTRRSSDLAIAGQAGGLCQCGIWYDANRNKHDIRRHRVAIGQPDPGNKPVIPGFEPGHPCIQSYIHPGITMRSEEHTSELQSLMRISYAVFCLKKKT